MPLTGLAGSPLSLPANIVPGYGSSPGRRFLQSELPLYRVRVRALADTTTFGPGALIAEFDRVQNLAYGDWANSVPEAFFTLHQDDPKITALRDKGGRAHVEIWRNNDEVWNGWVSLERDANAQDAIFYCYGYLADLFWLHTGWKQEWTNATVSTIVNDSWIRAKATLTKSRLGWVTTGTIEVPFTAAGGATPIVLPTYQAYRKRILFLMQEMAAIASSDTGQSSLFEVSHGTPTFNFWRDRRRTLTDVRWEWGNGQVQSFREYVMPVYHRNFVYGIGQNPRNAVLQKESFDSTDMDSYGRMEEALFFSWVRDETELDRVLRLRKVKGLQHDHQITLSLFPGSEVPPNCADSKWRIGDTVTVKINRGVTQVDAPQQVVGYMVSVLDGHEHVRPVVQEPL